MLRILAPRRLNNPISLVTLLLGLMMIISLPVHSNAVSADISRDEAISIVTDTQLEGSLDGIRLFVFPEMLPAGEVVSTWKKDVFQTPTLGWFIFVDRMPGANWEHPCWYLYVDAMTGVTTRFDEMVPPSLQTDLIEITNGRDNPDPGVSEASLERFSEQLQNLPKPPPDRGQSYAFIISGGANESNNHIRYWNDSAFIYRTLVEYYGYADDHIRVCISDGTNPATDRSNGTNSPPDLDGDGDDDIEYPATHEYIGQVFGELAATLSPSDQLFIFTTDHGGQESGYDCILNLWNWEELRDDQMAAYIDALPCETIICAFEQCFSGGMIDDIEGDGRVIATACLWSEYSWAMPPDYIYDTFVYHWTSAVAWQTPDGDSVDADTDNDGFVSMHEAFIYAEANDFDDETPQYVSNPAGLGDMLNLFGNMDGAYLTVEGIIIDDDDEGSSEGNDDGVIDFAETIELTTALLNMGLTDAENVVGTLTSTSPYVTILVDVANFGSIYAESSASNNQPFVFTVDNSIPDGQSLEFVLQVSEDPGELLLDLFAAAPSYAVTVSEINDSGGDGTANPGEDVSLTLRIDNLGSSTSPSMNAVLRSADYFEVNESPHPVTHILAGGSVSVPGFSVHISGLCPEVYTGELVLELSGAESYEASVDVFLMVGPWFDNVETDLGWTLGAVDDDASTGLWERSDPVGTEYNAEPVQPENDHTADPGHICFVTGNSSVGGTAGENDIDGGKTTLLSPLFNLEGATSATLSYWRWYTNDLGNNPSQDYWDVDVTSGGMGWIHLEHTTASDNSWTEQTFDLSSFIPFTSEVRFRFVASDEAESSLVEAAVDDIMVTIVRPPTTGVEDPIGSESYRLLLDHCVPNPMNPATQISFELPSEGPATLKIYDVSGRLVRTLLDEIKLSAGPQIQNWDGRNGKGLPVSSGVYFIRLQTPRAEVTRSVTLLR